MNTKIKICGIRTLEEALAVVEAGASILGFNFYPPSPRYIIPGECMRLVMSLETALREKMAQVTLVGVFVNSDPDYINAVFRDCHLDMVQLSGDEPPEVMEVLGERAFKVMHLSSAESMLEMVKRYPRRTMAPAWLVDAARPGMYGGTGQVIDWGLVCDLAAQVPILLAGGLRADNVAEAIRQVQPWGVDVASGVESAPGVKDLQKVADFVAAVSSVNQEIT